MPIWALEVLGLRPDRGVTLLRSLNSMIYCQFLEFQVSWQVCSVMARKCYLQLYSYENKVYWTVARGGGWLGWGILLRAFVTRPCGCF
jgi:hypothetical protein